MKVVLTKDVRDMGRSGSVIEVADGHAINFLFPRKLAVAATSTNLKQVEQRQKQMDSQRALSENLIAETLNNLAETPVVISRKANDKGHLYDAVDAGDIAAATNLPEDAVVLKKPIKELGEVEVPVAYGENFGSIKVIIEAQ